MKSDSNLSLPLTDGRPIKSYLISGSCAWECFSGEIPVSLGGLTRLTVLNLSRNKLTGWMDTPHEDFNLDS